MGAELRYFNGQVVSPHKYRLLFNPDEFASLGNLQIVEDSLPKMAAWGIKGLLAIQNREQLFKAYGQHQNITPNCHVRVVYASNELEDAKWISGMTGTATMIKEDVTESGDRYGSLTHISRTFHEVSRPLLTADEIMDLKKPQKDEEGRIVGSGEMIVFMAGERPIRGSQILYFRDPVFQQRAMIPPPSAVITTEYREVAFA
ncbi:MAG: type IV secretory system conjugative DNA transfer family protein [Acetobacteraceae bacterium]|nr:type IV secretory system conjugative DNA transfer family protein [Acetobacteraceae bacterium]